MNIERIEWRNVGGDLNGLMFGASDLELETFGKRKTSKGKDLGGSGMDSEICEFLEKGTQ